MVRAITERLVLLSGVGLVVAGVALIHVPTSLIVAGALLIAAVLWRRPWAA